MGLPRAPKVPCEVCGLYIDIDMNTDIGVDIRYTADSKKSEYGCRVIYVGSSSFPCWDQQTVTFQLSGFYTL